MKTFVTCVVTLMIAAPAFAQVRPKIRESRWFVSISGAVQNAPADLRETFTYPLHAEEASVEVAYPGKTAPLFDGAVGARLWRRYGLAVAFSRSSTSGSASVAARLPHPLYDNQQRPVAGEADAISRTETATHVQLYYDLPLDGRWRMRLFAGPTMVRLEQEIVESIDADEAYPFDTATFRSARTRRAKGSDPGFNVGADLGWMISRRIGAGALVRYARASVDLNADGTRGVSLDGGGLHVGGGLRFLF